MQLSELVRDPAAWAVTIRTSHLPLPSSPEPLYKPMLTWTWPHSVDLERRVIWAFRRQTLRPQAAGLPAAALSKRPGQPRSPVACDYETIGGVDSQPSDSAFIRACRRQPVSHAPVWYMRQAGRALPEYRATRAGVAMLEACTHPEMITEITLQPVRKYGVDAAIVFSDIVVPLRAVGVGVEIRLGVGPVIEKPIRTESDVSVLRDLEPTDVSFVSQAIAMLTAELGGTPLIGFAGGPFTLACYLIEGGPSKNFDKTRSLMYGNPELWRSLLDRLADITIAFLKGQGPAGPSAIPPFDSLVGIVSPQDYKNSVLPFSARPSPPRTPPAV